MTEHQEAILVTTDLSPLGDAALPVALRLARERGARLLVMSVVEVPPPPNPLYAHYYPTPGSKEVAEARDRLRAELRSRLPAAATKGVTLEVVVSEGTPDAEIARVAEERAVSMVVISTHGRSGVRRFLLGSVADRVLRLTRCPVLLVR